MRKSNKVIIACLLTVLCIIIYPGKTKAALQSNGGTPATKDINGWITSIRQMQATGGSLGLTDTINGTNLTSGNKNLDIHMEKNTEYGAIVLLSASSYGNPNKITDGGTTTGNATGVVMNINKEWVAAGISNTEVTSMKNASPRYKNVYPTPTFTNSNYQEKRGDAIATVGSWHGSSATTWLVGCTDREYGFEWALKKGGLLRAYGGSVFSYYGLVSRFVESGFTGASVNDKDWRDARNVKPWASRAIVVVGAGV